ncbi:MAG: response regulator [Spirochaetes bacterium]|nr:MAG: response regulator [Spirochaetota bacterium]
MKEVLIIGESGLFREYLGAKLEEYGMEVVFALNGLDGISKMRNELPDLVIMDHMLTRKSSMEVLADKQNDRNLAGIPVIMIASSVDKRHVVQMASSNVKKILSKPIKMDVLFKSISDLAGVEIRMDTTPSVLEAHFNEDILFIEAAQGLNTEKIELLRYKLKELLNLYDVRSPRILLMMSSLAMDDTTPSKIRRLLEIITENAQEHLTLIQILTGSEDIKKIVSSSSKFSSIKISDNLAAAMDSLIGLKPDSFAHEEIVQEKLLKATGQKKEGQETVQMRFDSEQVAEEERDQLASIFNSKATVAVVDDDLIIRELVRTVFSETSWELRPYVNGKEFLIAEKDMDFDLVFLDLMMPEIDGFQVLEYLKKHDKKLPIIVFSALSQKETIQKAISYGINSYMIKPLVPEKIQKKAIEVLSSTF